MPTSGLRFSPSLHTGRYPRLVCCTCRPEGTMPLCNTTLLLRCYKKEGRLRDGKMQMWEFLGLNCTTLTDEIVHCTIPSINRNTNGFGL